MSDVGRAGELVTHHEGSMGLTRKPGELRGWKEIAGYLKVGTLTAMRYANDREMPVRTFFGRVIAFSDEIDAWLDKMLVPRPPGSS